MNNNQQKAAIRTNPWVLFSTDSLIDVSAQVICFHAAGCQPTGFVSWRRYFSKQVAVVPIVLPMHGSRLRECMPYSLQEIAGNFVATSLELFSRPTILFGHSMGAMIAYEVACLLEARGRLPLALVVSGAQSPDRREVVDRTIGLTDEEFLDVLRAYGSISEELLQNREFLDYYLPVARSDFALCERYKWRRQPALMLPIHTFNGVDDTHISKDGIEQWSSFSRICCMHHFFDGGHFYCDQSPEEVCARIEALIRMTLR
ncbi:MAG: alpha/beta fold hydrolase [Coriobacteriales bacterium]|nr:alpha/beta fold hydrolase [Coriobacteriales bacterium]